MTLLEQAFTDARAAMHTAMGGEPYAAELTVQHCLRLAIDAIYAHHGAAPPAPSALAADLAERDPVAASLLRRFVRAPDTRARYVFLEDVVAHVRALEKGA